MAGIPQLKLLQLGQEAIAGTPVVATAIWRGPFTWADARVMEPAPEYTGNMFRLPRMITKSLYAQVTMPDQSATFEQLPYLFSACIEGLVDGVADGEGSGYIYEYPLPMPTIVAPQTYTLQVGDNQRADIIEYAYVEKFSLKGAGKEPLKLSCTWGGRQCTDGEFTASLVAPTVEDIIFGKSTTYLDATEGTIGTTPALATVLGFQVDCEPGLVALWSGDASYSFGALANIAPKLSGKLILRHDAYGEAELGYARAGTLRLLRISIDGSALTTAGTDYTYKTLMMDAAIQYTAVPTVAETEGHATVELSWDAITSVEDETVPTFTIVNELAALP